MDFVANRQPQRQQMLKEIGVKGVDELFRAIPKELILSPPAEDDGLSEYEGIRLMESLAAKNTYPDYDNYLGAGSYEHHVPALVDAICSRSEFLTAYTPYQAEASQGMLQTIFEFQSAICALTGMDAANASVYDGASACAEGLLMALRCQKKRQKILIAQTLHPHYRGVVEQYFSSQHVELATIPFLEDGRLDKDAFSEQLTSSTAAVLFQYPNFLGIIDDIKQCAAQAKEAGALTVICANPLVYGLYASAAELGADIAVGDCQPFGLSLQFGGPYVGYLACRQELVRQLPGRLVGETVDTKGRRGFVLTLQAREQHIRREKATSNICTNQALAALASLIALLWYGKEGVRELALTNYRRAAYLQKSLAALPHVSLLGDAPIFNEFVVKFDRPIAKVQQTFRAHRIEPGLHLGNYFPEMQGSLLVAVTETKNKEQLDRYVQAAQ
ncbi:MAG: aminomethyl-transferring glycine dehydrogenase subunit GcvPA [Waddliaceae bacterium]